MLNEYKIRHLNINDTEDMYSCIMRSYASMKNKEYFIHPTKEYLFEILCGKGKSYGTYLDNKLIGCASVVYEDKAITPLLEYQKIYNDNSKIIQFEHGVILPEYQGNNLLEKMLKHICEELYFLGYRYIISTVHPLNFPSLVTAFKIHQRAICLSKFYNKNIRFIMIGKIKSIDKAKFTDYKYLYPDQFSEISSILEKGYVAFNFDRRMRKLVLGIENET